jgi:hypothetical protein
MTKKTQHDVSFIQADFDNVASHLVVAGEVIDGFEAMIKDPNHPSMGAFKALKAILDSAANTLHTKADWRQS